jgi:hypothetical protein
MSDRNRKDPDKRRTDMPSVEKVQEELAKDPQPVGHPFRGPVSCMSLAPSFLSRIAFALRASSACPELVKGTLRFLP